MSDAGTRCACGRYTLAEVPVLHACGEVPPPEHRHATPPAPVAERCGQWGHDPLCDCKNAPAPVAERIERGRGGGEVKRYEIGLVRDIVTTEPSATNSVRRTETTIVTIETADDFNPDHGPNGYDLLGEWRIVSNVRDHKEARNG